MIPWFYLNKKNVQLTILVHFNHTRGEFMKIYVNIVLIIIMVVLLIGIVIPYLISQQSDVAVIIGFIIPVIVLPILYWWDKKIWVQIRHSMRLDDH